MGKGGSASEVKEVKASPIYPPPVTPRSELAHTLPQPTDAITKKSIRQAIPEHCFKRSYLHSLGVTAWDLTVAAFSMYAIHYANATLPVYALPAAWLFYWWYQSLTFTGLWVIAHECGHGGFTDSRLVNDVTGWLLHSALVTPYFSWAITHAKHHHYTNHMTMGETWVPSTADPAKKSVKYAKTVAGTIRRIVIVATVGWYAYLITNATGAKQNVGQSHFNPHAKALFKKKDQNFVRLSNVGVALALWAIGFAMYHLGFFDVARYFIVPQMGANFYLAAITFMQHTDVDVPHFNDDEWTWIRGALSTIDRSMGAFADYKTHYIVPSHVAHHIFSDMPYYGAMEATPYIKAHLGKYYKEKMPKPLAGSVYLGYWRDFYTAMKESVSVTCEEGSNYMWFH